MNEMKQLNGRRRQREQCYVITYCRIERVAVANTLSVFRPIGEKEREKKRKRRGEERNSECSVFELYESEYERGFETTLLLINIITNILGSIDVIYIFQFSGLAQFFPFRNG